MIKKEILEDKSGHEDVINNDTSFNLSNRNERIHKICQKRLLNNEEDDDGEFSRAKKIKTINDWIKLENDDSTDSNSDTLSSFENDTKIKKKISYSFTIEGLRNNSSGIDESENEWDSAYKKEEALLTRNRKKLQNLKIKLIHEVPPQHMIGNYAGCRGLKDHEKILFETYGPLRKGPFSLEEDKIIKNNWKKFCKLHNWKKDDIEPFISVKYRRQFYIPCLKERQKFVQFLANGLPWRSLFSVNQRFKIMYQKRISQRYTSSEDRKIIDYVEKQKKNTKKSKIFLNLGRILNRTRLSVWTHYKFVLKNRCVQDGENISTSKPVWTLSLLTRYINELLQITECDCIEELKNAMIPKIIWIKLEKKLNISYRKLKYFWVSQLHMQLFYPNIIYINDIKIQLIEYMYIKGIASRREIIWSNILKYFDGMTAYFLNAILFSLMKESDVKECKKKSFLDAIEYLYEKKIPEIQNTKFDKYLPRIKYTMNESI